MHSRYDLSSWPSADVGRVVFTEFNRAIVADDMVLALAEYCGERSLPAMFAEAPASAANMREQIAAVAKCVTLSRSDAQRVLGNLLHPDLSFLPFIAACRRNGIEVLVLTLAIEDLVEEYLADQSISGVKVIGTRSNFDRDGWRLHFRDDSVNGNAKLPYVLRAQRNEKRVALVSSEPSDAAAAIASDLRFAKKDSGLARILDANRLPYVPLDSFDRVILCERCFLSWATVANPW